MDVIHEDYSQLHYWNHTDLAYITHNKALREFYAYEPSLASIPEAIRTRKKYPVNRSLLLSVLKKQYNELGISFHVQDEVFLDENTFTITTAHQPTLLTGPLFHIYKIASTIHLAKELSETIPENTFIPLFLIGSEDHDWAEVNHLNIFGRRHQWEKNASGACGRLSLDGLDKVIHEVIELFPNALHVGEIKQILEDSLSKSANYSQFHRLLLHALFGRFGLVILDLDDIELKKSFVPIMEKEIREQFSYQHVTKTQSALEKAGFKPQAFCRPVNLFYMTDQLRERLDPHEGDVIRAESKVKYSIDEIISELHAHPDHFSPNVILRPLYEEFVLPNIAYIGGGGEIAYWLDRKNQFEAAGVYYPMLIRRNSLLIIDGPTKSQLDKIELTWKDLLPGYDAIVKTYLRKHSQNELHYDQEMEMIRKAYEVLAGKAERLDPTLAKAILAEQSKQVKQFEQLGSRLLRTEKQQQDTNLKRIQRLKEKLFPEGGLQERHENFLSFYTNYGPQWIDKLVEICNPFDEKFMILELQAQEPSAA